MNESGLKPKRTRGPQSHLRWLIPPLLVVMCLGFRQIMLVPYAASPCQSPLFYPWLILTHHVSLRTALWVGVVLGCLLLLKWAWHQRVALISLLITCLICGGVLLNIWMDGRSMPQIVFTRTSVIDDTTYRLIYVVGEGQGVDTTYPIRTFVLFMCDGLGEMSCETFGVVDMTVGGWPDLTDEEIQQTFLVTAATNIPVYQVPELYMNANVRGTNPRSFLVCMMR